MKHVKKLLALAIAMVMVLGTMNIGTVFAAGNDGLNTDAKISITGLTDGDTVKLFKVLEWTDGTGWTLTEAFASLDLTKATGVDALIKNTPNTQLTDADLKEIATVAQTAASVNGTGTTLDGTTTFEYNAGAVEKSGMYVALVTAAKAGTVYNPIVVSADFSADNATNTIPASSVINGTSVAKKKEITVEKTEPKITNDVGDTYNYTVTTSIPVYSSAFTDQYFTVQDTLSDYLDFDANSVKVNDMTLAAFVADAAPTASGDLYTWTPGDHGFTLKFNHDFVSKLEAAVPITITYSAKLNVPKDKLTNLKEEKNDVTVTFPNNPNDLTGKKVTALKDGTREYTFSIDGKLFGNSKWDTAELVKVGLDKNNSPIEAVINVSNGSSHAALKDAKYVLFTDKTAADNYSGDGSDIEAMDNTAKTAAKVYYNDVFNGIVTTNAMGLMEINGLDVGTYYLKEVDAPAGYIKDGKSHKIEITADIDGDAEGETGEEITEWYTVNETTGAVTWYTKDAPAGAIEYKYNVPVLNSYTIKIDDAKSSTYTMTLDGPSVSSVKPAESSTDLVNTKGVELPSTGGMGTTIFYIIGAVLVLGAGILLVTRRRMSAN